MPDNGYGAAVAASKLPLDFRVTCRQAPSATVVAVAGDIDLSTITYFSEALEGGVRRAKTDVVVDMEGVTFIDAVGLGALIRTHRLVSSQEGRRMIVCNVPPPTRRLFELTGLNHVFQIGTLSPS
jgi:anti-anti-sigma factor